MSKKKGKKTKETPMILASNPKFKKHDDQLEGILERARKMESETVRNKDLNAREKVSSIAMIRDQVRQVVSDING